MKERKPNEVSIFLPSVHRRNKKSEGPLRSREIRDERKKRKHKENTEYLKTRRQKWQNRRRQTGTGFKSVTEGPQGKAGRFSGKWKRPV